MGQFINPSDQSKEQWLQSHAHQIHAGRAMPDNLHFDPNVERVLRWVDNGPFTALGVMYCKGELEACCRESETDPRQQKWYVVPKEFLADYSAGGYEKYLDFWK